MRCFLTVKSLKGGYIQQRLPCEDIEAAMRAAAPYFASGMAPHRFYYGVFDVKCGALQTIYFDQARTNLREDVAYISIKTASGLLETEYHKA